MAKKAKLVARSTRTGRFVITRQYVRRQAEEALRTFVAPVAGAAKAFQKAGEPAPEQKLPAEV